MRPNQGIQKYRETSAAGGKAATKSTKASAKAEKAEKLESAKAAAKAIAEKSERQKREEDERKERHEKVTQRITAKAKARAQEIASGTNMVVGLNGAIDEKAAAEQQAAEEAALQREIAEELERESHHTSTLVKEDYSPVNATRERLVTEYAPLIKYIAQKIAARLPANIELDDLISSGVIGLMDAIEKYDSSRDNKFKTYAEFRIRGAILDELRAQDWVPRSVREKAKILERCYNKIEQERGRQATDEEVCAELNISQVEYHELVNQVRSVSLLSFDDVSSFSKQDKRALHGYGEGGSKVPTPYSEVSVAAIKRLIAEAINDLPEKQRLVLSLYYYEDLNLKEIGRVLDVTESRVSQLHTQAILRLKSKLRSHWDEVQALMG